MGRVNVLAKSVQSSGECNMASASGESAPSAAGRLWPARRMVITVHESAGADTTVLVDKPFARVGRDRRAEVHVDGPSVLPCQLYLHATDDGIYCLSLSADANSGWLTAGSKIRVGDHRVSAAFADGPPARAGRADLCARHGAVAPVPLITVAAGRQQIAIRDVALHRQLTLVGRQPPGTLCVRHRTISRAHCVLHWDGRQLWLIDLLSSNGTRLDGERFDAGTVQQGGTFRLGDIRFHFVTTAPLDHDRLHSDSGSGLLDVPSDSDLLPGIPADPAHVAEAVHSDGFAPRRAGAAEGATSPRGAREWDGQLRELADRLRQQREETERMLAARETAETRQGKKIEQLESDQTRQLAEFQAKLADALNASQHERELVLSQAAQREAELAALRQSLTSIDEKLAHTEARLIALPAKAAEDKPAAAALEERLQALAELLAQQQQQEGEERARLEQQLTAREAAEANQAKQLKLLETKLAEVLSTARQERELLLDEAADREAQLAAVRQSLTSIEEKLARTEARLNALPAKAAEDNPADSALEERLQALAELLAQQQQQQREERARLEQQLAAREAAEANQAKQFALLETKLAEVLSTARQERELLLDEAADREAQLAAVRQSLTSIEEKLARTEARLNALPAKAAEDNPAAAALEERFQALAEQLAQQQQQHADERARLEQQLAAREAAEANQTKQLALLEKKLAEVSDAAQQDVLPSLSSLENKLARAEAAETTLKKQLAELEIKLASARTDAQHGRDLIRGELTAREASLAAMNQSLTLLEEKLARTEAQLAATSAQAADDRRANSTWEQRFADIDERLAQQREERLALDAAPVYRETDGDAPTREALTALEEKLLKTEARLTALAEQLNSTARPAVTRDGSRAAAAPSGEWMIDDEHTRRLLAFRHKRESKQRWRQLAWVGAAGVILAVGAVVTGIFIQQRNGSAANHLPEPTTKASIEP